MNQFLFFSQTRIVIFLLLKILFLFFIILIMSKEVKEREGRVRLEVYVKYGHTKVVK